MAPIKSSITRVLRTQNLASRRVVLSSANRGLTRIVPEFTPIQCTVKLQPTPFESSEQEFRGFVPSARNPASYTITNKFSRLINDITTNLSTTSSPDLTHLTKLLSSYTSNSEHWTRFAFPDPNAQYTRNLVAEVPGLFNLLLLVWTPGKKSPVHDHADAHCLMKVLRGELRERRYSIPTEPGKQSSLVQTSELRFKLNQVSYIADDLGLHEIANPSNTEYAISLHLYTPPNAAMRGCHIYDLENGERKHVMQGAWHSVAGKLIEHE